MRDFVKSFGKVQEYYVYVEFGINIARNFVEEGKNVSQTRTTLPKTMLGVLDKPITLQVVDDLVSHKWFHDFADLAS